MTGLETSGPCCSRTRKTSRRYARPSSATWPSSSPTSTKRNVKIIGLSVDPVNKHADWANDIKVDARFAPNYPMIGDTDLKVSKLYGMLPETLEGTCDGRTAADNQTVRNVFVIGPDKKIKLILVYPMTTGRNSMRSCE